MGDVINITTLNNVWAANIKEKCDLNNKRIMIKKYIKVDIARMKEYQQDVYQLITNYGVSRNWLHNILHNSMTEELQSKIDEMYIWMEDEGYFSSFLYFNIFLDVMYFITPEFVQAP